MQTVKIKAVEGRLIRMPERNFEPVPNEPIVVERTPYYMRALIDGDIVEVEDAPELPMQSPPAETRSAARGSKN